MGVNSGGGFQGKGIFPTGATPLPKVRDSFLPIPTLLYLGLPFCQDLYFLFHPSLSPQLFLGSCIVISLPLLVEHSSIATSSPSLPAQATSSPQASSPRTFWLSPALSHEEKPSVLCS